MIIALIALGLSTIALAILATLYANQRDDLAAWIVHTHPEDFE